MLMHRSQYLLETGQWSDCQFIVGQEPDQQLFKAHRLLLAASSPVFEVMFFRAVFSKDEAIRVVDIHPTVFKALLKFIYTDRVMLVSFDFACELCYCATKYMMPSLVQLCTRYLLDNLTPSKACRGYEFAKLFDVPFLEIKCMQMMRCRCKEVIESWDDAERSTILMILKQDMLVIDSEVQLFNAVESWARAECVRESLDPSEPMSLMDVVGDLLTKIRFLVLSPAEFAEGPGISPLLTQQDAFAILMNISSRKSEVPMPDNFSTSTQKRSTTSPSDCSNLPLAVPEKQYTVAQSRKECSPEEISPPALIYPSPGGSTIYCRRAKEQMSDVLNSSVMTCSLSFLANKSVHIIGIQVPTQTFRTVCKNLPPPASYTELLHADLLNSYGTRLSYGNFNDRVETREKLIDVTFNRPIIILKERFYEIRVRFSTVGWYPTASYRSSELCDKVLFVFGADADRQGLIRSIMFKY